MNEITNIPSSVGQYSATTKYEPQDRVYNNGSIFASLAEQTGNEPTLTVNEDGEYDASDGWMLIAVSEDAVDPSDPTIAERVTALENGKIDKPTTTGTAGQHLYLKDASTGETGWENPPVPQEITVDDQMSEESTNPLQNKVITEYWYKLGAKIDEQLAQLNTMKATLDNEVSVRAEADSALNTKVTSQQTSISQNASSIDSLIRNLTNFRSYVNQVIGNGLVHIDMDERIEGQKYFLERLFAMDGIFLDSEDSTLRNSGVSILFDMDDDGKDGHIQLIGAFDDIRVSGVKYPTEDSDAANKYYVDEMVATVPKLERQVVDELPSVGDSNTIYLVRNGSASGTDLYSEYIYIKDHWELLGTASADFSNYYTKSEVNALNLNAVHKTGDETVNGTKTFAKIMPVILDMDGRTINNVGTPSADTDAANKAYVDAKAGSGYSDFTTSDIDTIWEEVF